MRTGLRGTMARLPALSCQSVSVRIAVRGTKVGTADRCPIVPGQRSDHSVTANKSMHEQPEIRARIQVLRCSRYRVRWDANG
jgi:hypothetical protein